MLDDADRCSFTQNKFNPRVFSPEHRDQRSQQTVGCRADKTNLQAAAGAAGAAGAAERTACRFAQLLASNQEFAGLNQNGTVACVSTTPLDSRANNFARSSDSSFWIDTESGGCAMCRRSAARRKFSVSARTTKWRMRRRSIGRRWLCTVKLRCRRSSGIQRNF